MTQRDLRELIRRLEEQGKLYRFHKRINKETELFPLYRIQMRGLPDSERKVFLFDNVVGGKGQAYEMSVLAGIYGASEEILAIGMGCESYVDMLEKWHKAVASPENPVVVAEGPVHEEVHTGKELQEFGLDEFPVPLEEPGFSGILRTGLPIITKDLETGIRNVGAYNTFFRARDRLVAGIGMSQHAMAYHWQSARRRGEGLPVAIVIGCNPEVMIAASSKVAYGVDELAIAGGMAGSPVELVRCCTVPLEVPAHAEAVIEGVMSTKIMEPGLPFGEYPGYMRVGSNFVPVIQVTAITHRRKAMFTPIQVGLPPSENNLISAFCHSALLYHHLRYESRLPVDEVYFPQMGGGGSFCLVRVSEGCSQESVRQILHEAGDSKYIIAVDSDIRLQDPDLLVWALSFRTQPEEDFTFAPGGYPGLDPSAPPAEKQISRGEAGSGKVSRVMINATRKWPYPPVALPKRKYMERALQIWRDDVKLSDPYLLEPWHGYHLGSWDEGLEEIAGLMTEGEYLKVGERMAKLQKKVS
jgi:4-hydroxy-3-polyprenylbenzoate decarboxylase